MAGERRLALAVAAATFLVATQARAASFTIDGGAAHETPESYLPGWWGGNDVIPLQPGYVGAQLAFTGVAGQRYLFRFEFVGFEAEWVDTLQTGGGSITNRAATHTSVAFALIATGLSDIVPFSFVSGAPTPLTVDNGDNLPPSPYRSCDPVSGQPPCLPNFFLSIASDDRTGGTAARSGPVVWLALDDNGAGPDADHDDWVGLVRVTPVPEPGSLVLLGGGLLASAAHFRRRYRQRRTSARQRSLAGSPRRA